MNDKANSEQIIIIGYSGHAYVVVDTIYSTDGIVKGYCTPEKQKSNPFDLLYLGFESDSILSDQNWIIAIGDNLQREKIYQKFSNIGKYKSVAHVTAVISDFTNIAAGVFISANTSINALVNIGIGAIINTGAIIEHECQIGSFAHVAPGAVLAGNVYVGERSFIGANSVVKQGVKIGNDVTIGAGSVVIRDVPDGLTVVGNPARKLIR
jgi:sugar O-acyltransferase (sialic acid O-acetyltransferase NeuD family)